MSRLCLLFLADTKGVSTQAILPHGTPAEVRAEVRRLIDCLGPNGGYVLNSIHNIQDDVPAENIIAMFDEAREYHGGLR